MITLNIINVIALLIIFRSLDRGFERKFLPWLRAKIAKRKTRKYLESASHPENFSIRREGGCHRVYDPEGERTPYVFEDPGDAEEYIKRYALAARERLQSREFAK